MKKIIIILVIFLGLVAIGYIGAAKYLNQYHKMEKMAQETGKDIYYCPMHPSYTSDKAGNCPFCGMRLVKKENPKEPQGTKVSERKILYYRNPMNPEVTSPTPMKDSMGMDYVPVYEEAKGGQGAGVYISPEKQQLIGVEKEKVMMRHLAFEIRAVGKVAYDPELYVAQQEYLQALKTKDSAKDSSIPLVKQQIASLVEAAQSRLLLLGMSKDEIQELAKQGKPQANLYLPTDENTAWVYAMLYEYEQGLVKEGAAVEVEAIAFPGEIFEGRVVALKPVLDSTTRTQEMRVEVKDPNHKLKPQMYVNAKIKVDLGDKLAVPDSAVLDTGVRKIVYLAGEGDRLQARDITVGQKAQGYDEVLTGLKEGDVVVTSGNFLVDSESKLKSPSQESERKDAE